jgi:hypothetical protein
MSPEDRTAARSRALRVSIRCIARSLPKEFRTAFVRDCTRELRERFSANYCEIYGNSFCEAIAVIDRHMVDARARVELSRSAVSCAKVRGN